MLSLASLTSSKRFHMLAACDSENLMEGNLFWYQCFCLALGFFLVGLTWWSHDRYLRPEA